MKEIKIFLLLTLIATLVRSISLLFSVIDWDESLYMLIAESLSHGKMPYQELFDHKPPAIYYLFLMGKYVFGDVILGARFTAIFSVAISAFLIYKLVSKIQLVRSRGLRILTAVAFIVFSVNSTGISSNTEIFFIPFVLAGTYFAFDARNISSLNSGRIYLFISGLMFGLGFSVKYHAIFDFAAVFGFLFSQAWIWESKLRELEGRRKMAGQILIILAGFCTPLLITILYFWSHDYLNEYLYYAFTFNFKTNSIHQFSIIKFAGAFALQIKESSFIYLGGLVFLVLSLWNFKGDKSLHRQAIFFAIWLAVDLIAISLTKKFYRHYYLQIYPILCMMTIGTLSLLLQDVVKQKRVWLNIVIFGSVFSSILLPMFEKQAQIIYERITNNNSTEGDEAAQIASYLNEQGVSGEYIFILGGQPIIYYLTNAKYPTRYAYPPFFLDEKYIEASGIELDDEIPAILSKKPSFIITKRLPNTVIYNRFLPILDSDYHLTNSINETDIYKRNGTE